MEWTLKDFAEIVVETENQAVNAAQRKLLVAILDLRASQTGRKNDGMEDADHEDFVELVNDSRAELTRFNDQVNPADMPNSSPVTDVVEPASD